MLPTPCCTYALRVKLPAKSQNWSIDSAIGGATCTICGATRDTSSCWVAGIRTEDILKTKEVEKTEDIVKTEDVLKNGNALKGEDVLKTRKSIYTIYVMVPLSNNR